MSHAFNTIPDQILKYAVLSWAFLHWICWTGPCFCDYLFFLTSQNTDWWTYFCVIEKVTMATMRQVSYSYVYLGFDIFPCWCSGNDKCHTIISWNIDGIIRRYLGIVGIVSGVLWVNMIPWPPLLCPVGVMSYIHKINRAWCIIHSASCFTPPYTSCEHGPAAHLFVDHHLLASYILPQCSSLVLGTPLPSSTLCHRAAHLFLDDNPQASCNVPQCSSLLGRPPSSVIHCATVQLTSCWTTNYWHHTLCHT